MESRADPGTAADTVAEIDGALCVSAAEGRSANKELIIEEIVMRLPIRLLNGSANAIVRRLGMEPQEELRSARSSTELASLISRSATEGTLDPDTAELYKAAAEKAKAGKGQAGKAPPEGPSGSGAGGKGGEGPIIDAEVVNEKKN